MTGNGANRLRAIAASLVLNGAVPLLVYVLARPYLPGDVSALAVAMAVPVAGTVAVFAWRRRLDVIGVVAVVTYGIALLVASLSGGDPFVLKLQEAIVTGPVGLAFLLSAAVRRPLLLVVVRALDRRRSRAGSDREEQRRRHASTVLTAIMGGTFVVHALALTVLALVLSTTEVLALSRLVGLSILGLGLIVLLGYRGRLQRAAKSAAEAATEAASLRPGPVAQKLP